VLDRATRSLVTTGVLAFVTAALGAQQPPQQTTDQKDAQQPPRFRVESNFVRIDAYPLRDGKPVMDLKGEDFQVFEDGAAQKIETFEHVVVRPAGPQSERTDVSSQRESLQAAANPRNRVFVIFLDTPHVMVDSAHHINEPLIRMLDRIIGPDDLVGVMTPAMAANQIVLGRKTQVIEDSLRQNWPWGTRFSLLRDNTEASYETCYGLTGGGGRQSELSKELIARKRERATLDSLQDLVRYLRTVREERKAIITVSEGWLLYGPNRAIVEPKGDPQTGHMEPIPGVDPVGVGLNGKLTTKDPRNRSEGALTNSECAADRFHLAMIDDKQYFKDIMDEANRANASFYPIDPRGLPAFDNPIGPEAPPPITVDQAMLKQRIEILRTLAENTDGMAVVNSNDLDRGLKRISDDFTSYYLLGYYSTNSKLDGQFRSVKVKVKQPGIDVRARRGYRAATQAEVTAARTAADAPIPESKRAVESAIDRLGRARADTRFLINAVMAKGTQPTLWVAGELMPPVSGRPDEFAQGGTADIEAKTSSGSQTTRVTLRPGERTFVTSVAGVGSGEIAVVARVRAPDGGLPISDTMRVEAGTEGAQPMFFKRSPSTGNRLVPTADTRFSRTERVRLEIPVDADVKPGAGRVLDRAGQPIPVPVAVGERKDEVSGQRWITADVVLAPLAAADYGIEVEIAGPTASQRIVTAIRIVR